MTIYYLYVKTHRITGLQYLGFTSRKDPHKYTGSGTRWNLHLQKYGYNYDTIILHRCVSKSAIRAWGLYYSKLWSVVSSKKWANLKEENGDGGGCFGAINGMYGKTHTPEEKIAQGLRASVRFKGKSYEELYGKEKANDLKKQRSLSTKGKDNSGSKNPRYDANNYYFMNTLTGEIVYCTRTTFMLNHSELKKSGICDMINKASEYKNWFVIYSF